MSEKNITPSGLKARYGWRESSMAISGVSDRIRNGYFVEYSLNAAMYRPACRMSQTGERSTAWPRAALTRSGAEEEDA